MRASAATTFAGAALSLTTLALAQPARQPSPAPPASAAPALLDKGEALAREGRSAEAERVLRQALAANPRSVRAMIEIARLESARGSAASALPLLRQARGLAPNSEDVLAAYAEAELAAPAPLSAIPALEALVRMHPSVGHYRYLMGVALLESGDVVAAVDPLKEAERLEPKSVPTLLALGTALNERKLYPDAQPVLLRALSLAPDRPDVLAATAEAEEGLGELPAAEAHAQGALAREAGNARAQLVVGMVRLRQQRYPEARDALLRAVAAGPASSKAHYQLSLALARLNDEAGSQRELALSRETLAQSESRVAKVRALTGFSQGGMQR